MTHPLNIIQISDRAAILKFGLEYSERQLSLAKKQRKLACAKLKKAEHTTITPKRRFALEQAVNVACQEVTAWERRIQAAKMMGKELAKR